MASTPQLPTASRAVYGAAWRRVWWRDGRVFRSPTVHLGPYEASP